MIVKSGESAKLTPHELHSPEPLSLGSEGKEWQRFCLNGRNFGSPNIRKIRAGSLDTAFGAR